MRWRRNTPYPRPKSCEKRILIKWAWWPTDIGDHTVWLEFYFIEEEWREAGEIDTKTLPASKIIYQSSGWRKVRVFAQRKA